MGCTIVVLIGFAVLVGGVYLLHRHDKKRFTLYANGGMIASARKRREMLHEAGRKAMEDFNQGVK